MKKVFLILLIFTGIPLSALSQEEDRDAQHERIKALKVAFFTQELDFSDKVAEKFWPIYNKYEEDRHKLHEREHIEFENVKCINEDEANALLSEFLTVESEEYKIKKQLFKDLREIMTAKDIIKLYKLEDEFHKKLIKEYRAKRDNKESNSNK